MKDETQGIESHPYSTKLDPKAPAGKASAGKALTRKTLIVSLTPNGQELADQIRQHYSEAEHWYKPQSFINKVQQAFLAGYRIIFICATGIVVRALAPVLQDKKTDPPVMVLDEAGQFVVPLLSGHEGGANQWATALANKLNAKAVLTTARTYAYPIYTVGMGCERGCPKAELDSLLTETLNKANISIEQVTSISSIDIKQDEVGLLALSELLNKPYRTFGVQQLTEVESLISEKSEYVFKTVGVYGVAESAALYAVQQVTQGLPELLVTKQKSQRATCAIARGYVESV